MAAIYLNRSGDGDLVRAEEHLNAASAINSTLPEPALQPGPAPREAEPPGRSRRPYLQEIADSAKSFKALFNLSRVYRLMGREEEEYDALQKTIAVNPEFPIAYFYLARIELRRGRDFEQAITLVKKGIELKPEPADLPLGYFLLADLYNRVGDVARSEEYARKGQSRGRAAASAAADDCWQKTLRPGVTKGLAIARRFFYTGPST